MKIDVLTLFPEMFTPITGASILKRALDRGTLKVELTNIRDFTYDKHRVVDDYPFGGGAGMVLKAEPLVLATEAVLQHARQEGLSSSHVVLLSPGGRVYKQTVARELVQKEHLVLLCGHYEGVDQRVVDLLVDEEISIGDYVLTGGELPAMVIIDSVARLIPGVLGSEESSVDESFSADNLLEYPQYTRPREFRGLEVPDVLLSGHHRDIARWRKGQAIMRTRARRPDLYENYKLTKEDIKALELITSRREG